MGTEEGKMTEIEEVINDKRSWWIEQGDVLSVLKKIPDNTFHVVCTSPPYYGLRSYKVSPTIWGDNKTCEHVWEDEKYTTCEKGNTVGQFCVLCNAWRGCLGLEPTPQLYVEHLVQIFHEVKRCLRKDGVFWLNVGSSYATDNETSNSKTFLSSSANKERKSYKSLDLIDTPHLLAEALRADGWYVRCDVIWCKKSATPENIRGWRWEKHKVKVKDSLSTSRQTMGDTPNNVPQLIGKGWGGNRTIWKLCSGCSKCVPNDGYVLRKGSWRPTRSHEYIFMLTKSKEYYSDGESVKTPASMSSINRSKYSYIVKTGKTASKDSQRGIANNHDMDCSQSANLRDVWKEDDPYELLNFLLQKASDETLSELNEIYRQKSSTWWLPPEANRLQHYAGFPSSLPFTCLKSSVSGKGACIKCGSPYTRIVDAKYVGDNSSKSSYTARSGVRGSGLVAPPKGIIVEAWKTLGWKKTCNCETDDVIPSFILDPFVGSGTTLVVARRMGLRAIGIELSEDYVKMARNRLEKDLPLFNSQPISVPKSNKKEQKGF